MPNPYDLSSGRKGLPYLVKREKVKQHNKSTIMRINNPFNVEYRRAQAKKDSDEAMRLERKAYELSK